VTVTGEEAGENGAAPPHAATPAATAPAESPPLNAIALAKEVVLERIQNLLEWLLRRLKRYRAGRGDWWEK
jgi:hypothetical protein